MKRISITISSIVLCYTVALFGCSQKATVPNSSPQTLSVLDSNGDKILTPYEAMDMLLLLQEQNEGPLSLGSFEKIATKYQNETEEEIMELFSEFDADKNGKIEVSEAKGEMAEFIEMMDENEDGVVTTDEASTFDFTDALLADEEEIQERIEEVFQENDANQNGILELTEIDAEERDGYIEYDANRDGVVAREEIYAYMKADNIPISFEVDGTTAYMTGVITNELPAVVLQLLFEHPEVTTIEMLIVPGSIDDEANLRAALYVNQFGLTTKLNANSAVASGGTDFFLAGKQRIVEKGATLGVHSWGGGSEAATDVPKDDPVHEKYLDFYRKVNVPEEFYWYTLEAASANDIHLMTEEEIKKYNIRTKQL